MSAARDRFVGRLTATGYAAGWGLIKALPEPVALRLFRAGADLAVRRRGPGVRRLEANLARVVGELGEQERADLTRAAMRSYARYWCEVFRLSTMSRERIVGGMQTEGFARWQEALAAPTGTILALPHSGNWDHAGAYCSHMGVPFATVAERLEPASVYDRFVAFRESLGMEVLAFGDRTIVRTLRQRLEAGGMLCLMADRDLSSKGVDVTMFGAPARMPAGPASLALKTGATLLPVTLSFTDTGWKVVWHEAVPHTDVATMTQHLADVFGRGIREHPQDWHMLQRYFLDDDLDADRPA